MKLAAACGSSSHPWADNHAIPPEPPFPPEQLRGEAMVQFAGSDVPDDHEVDPMHAVAEDDPATVQVPCLDLDTMNVTMVDVRADEWWLKAAAIPDIDPLQEGR